MVGRLALPTPLLHVGHAYAGGMREAYLHTVAWLQGMRRQAARDQVVAAVGNGYSERLSPPPGSSHGPARGRKGPGTLTV